MKISLIVNENIFFLEGISDDLTVDDSKILAPQTDHIYFEKQVDKMCGLKCLNNFFGYHAFTRGFLNFIAVELKKQYHDIDIGSEPEQFKFSRNIDDYE